MSTEDETKTETTPDGEKEYAAGVTLTLTGPRSQIDFLLENMTLPLEQVGETIIKDHPAQETDATAKKLDIVAVVVMLSPTSATTGDGVSH